MSFKSIKDAVGNLSKNARRFWLFATEDVWDIELDSLSVLRRMGVSLVRVVTLIFKGFKDDECSMHASSLTFSSLMAIVPILALSLAVARGFGDDTAKNWIQGQVQEWTASFSPPGHMGFSGNMTTNSVNGVTNRPTDAADVPGDKVDNEIAVRINQIVEKGFEKVDNINFTKLGAVGLVLLIWMVISVLGRIERSFNRVWGVKSGRNIWRCFTDYLSVLLVLPILMGAAASLPIMSVVTKVLGDGTSAFLHSVVSTGAFKNITVLLMTSLGFTFLLMFMPNTKVKFKAGFMGGFVTAVLFIGWLSICAWMQVGVARSSKIYGSFAIVPILLAWVHMSWEIVLLGAEVAFAVQHYDTYKMEQRSNRASLKAKMVLALSVVCESARSMLQGAPPLDVSEYASKNKLPIRFLNAVVDVLVDAGYLGLLADTEDRYVLLKSPSAVEVVDVIDVMMDAGIDPEGLGLSRVAPNILKIVQDSLENFGKRVQGKTIESLIT